MRGAGPQQPQAVARANRVPFGHQCGNWQDAYSALHQDILRGRAPQRFAVARGFSSSGLADTLIGAVTVFLFALLTDRAFQVQDRGAIKPS